MFSNPHPLSPPTPPPPPPPPIKWGIVTNYISEDSENLRFQNEAFHMGDHIIFNAV